MNASRRPVEYVFVRSDGTSTHPIRRQSQSGFTWRPGLDGLRGIAIIAVVLVHFKTADHVPGGSFGVDLFFVLSGFLITVLLLKEWETTGSISLHRFYARRALRLLPAFFVFCAAFVLVIALFSDHRFTASPGIAKTLASVGYALTYSLNWPVALGMTPPPGFGHLWSLAVEEQYYLLWPGVLLFLLRTGVRPFGIIFLTVAAIVCSASIPLFFPDLGWRRLNFGSDFRAQELLCGSLLAQLYVYNLIREHFLNRLAFKAVFGFAGLALLFMVLVMNKQSILMYQGGFTLLTMICAVMVLGAAFTRSGILPWLLGGNVLVYLGRRSYALYLWHMPIGIWLRHLDTLEQLICAGLLSILAAELSFRLIERPALRLKDRFSGLAAQDGARPPNSERTGEPSYQAA